MVTFAACIDHLIATHGTLRAVARMAKVDPGYLSRLRYGERQNPSEEVLKALGLTRIVSYQFTNPKGPTHD